MSSASVYVNKTKTLMTWLIQRLVRAIRTGQAVYAKKWSFLAAVLCISGASFMALVKLDLLPEAPKIVAAAPRVEASTDVIESAVPVAPELPLIVRAPKIGLETTVANPTAVDIASLDRALLTGAVRHPTSARLNEAGNVVLFAHSSYLPVVGNKAYKAFNNIQKLISGDTIEVVSGTTVYIYHVRSVKKENATFDAIPLRVTGKVLTLSTCDSFGAKSDRFVVTADFVESHPVAS